MTIKHLLVAFACASLASVSGAAGKPAGNAAAENSWLVSTGTVSGRGRFSRMGLLMARMPLVLTNSPWPAPSVCSAVCPAVPKEPVGVTSIVPSQV